jgi:hypothetical protein
VGEGKRVFAAGQQSMAKLLFVRFTLIRTVGLFLLCVCAAADKTVKTKKRYMCEREHLWLGDRSLWAMIGNGGKFRNQIKVSFIIFFPLFFHNTNQSAWYYSRKKWTFCLCQPIQFEDGAATK